MFDFDADDYTIPWPRKGDKIFTSGDDKLSDAIVEYMYDPWGRCIHGFKHLADIGVENVLNKQQFQDTLVFSIVYCYRHYIELSLKEIIGDGYALLDHPDTFPQVHRLDKLWDLCKDILVKAGLEGPQEDLETVDEYIRQFHNVDPKGEA